MILHNCVIISIAFNQPDVIEYNCMAQIVENYQMLTTWMETVLNSKIEDTHLNIKLHSTHFGF